MLNKMEIIIALLLFLSIYTNVNAHEDFDTINDYNNIKVRVKTGYSYEEINKCMIIGQLAEILSKELNYNQEIFLDFTHFYVEDCNPVYFISFDKGAIQYSWSKDKQEDIFKDSVIIIRQTGRKFDAISTLKLVEYAIKNLTKIKSEQRRLNYNHPYCQWTINSIDTNIIHELQSINTSIELKRIIQSKVYRPNKDFKSGISYYWQNNKYYVISKDYNKEELVLLSLDNIFFYKDFHNPASIIFDTDSSFYYVDMWKNNFVSKKQVIMNHGDYYGVYQIEDIGGDKISIYYYNIPKKIGVSGERTLIYLIDKDELIQNLEIILIEYQK